jgi:hypothetical protein
MLAVGVGLAAAAVFLYALRRYAGAEPARMAAAPARARRRGELERARKSWRAPALDELGRIELTPLRRVGLLVLRGYLLVAVGMVVVRVIQSATG